MLKETTHLKECAEEYVGGFKGKRVRNNCYDYIITSKIKGIRKFEK